MISYYIILYYMLYYIIRGSALYDMAFPLDASVQWQPDDLTIHTDKWFLGAGFVGAPLGII